MSGEKVDPAVTADAVEQKTTRVDLRKALTGAQADLDKLTTEDTTKFSDEELVDHDVRLFAAKRAVETAERAYRTAIENQ